jgi:L-seryl-tRNA(Ser) seleniumtransferase
LPHFVRHAKVAVFAYYPAMNDPIVTLDGWSRRQLFRAARALGPGALLPAGAAQAAQPAARGSGAAVTTPSGRDLYASLGVRPMINARGTLTIIGGSMELPDVRAAKAAANQLYVNLEELMEAAGARLAELTGAEWGMVSSGCAAAMSHATAACVAGGNPDLHVRIPDLRGFTKSEVIIPGHSRNVYDAAIRAVGVTIVEANTPDELALAIGPKTAMIYVFANPGNEAGPMSLEAMAQIAKPRGVPIMVDAAAEILTVPNIHLQRGATLVGYSGGKILRGPQSAGILLGRKDLGKAAWMHSAPHHGYARAMKVGREEVVGMLVAIDRWVKGDRAAEWAGWVTQAEVIAAAAERVPGVTAIVAREPWEDRSNRSPRVTIRWTAAQIGLTGQQATDRLYDEEPRIAIGGASGPREGLAGDTGIALTTSMLAPGDEQVVADRIRALLSAKHTLVTPPPPAAPAGDATGQWRVEISFVASTTTHVLQLRQQGSKIEGSHQGDFLTRDLTGTIEGPRVTLVSRVTERTGDALNYRFTGELSGDSMSGSLDLGEYRTATWKATRRAPGGAA